MVADLGIASSADIVRRVDDVIRFLPGLWHTAETIMAQSG
jgi:hypothetical protein